MLYLSIFWNWINRYFADAGIFIITSILDTSINSNSSVLDTSISDTGVSVTSVLDTIVSDTSKYLTNTSILDKYIPGYCHYCQFTTNRVNICSQ